MRRPVVTVTIRNEQGDVLHSEKRSAFNAGIRASEDAIREIARAAHTTYEADRPSRVGDVYTRRWVSRDGRAIVATIEKEPETAMEARKDDEQILNAAEKAGIRYANDQLGSDYFMDWVREQVAEAEQMRRNDPSSVMPTETKSQARKVARNMLQQLEWDTKRELNVLDYVSAGDVKPEEVVKKFYEGFDWALRGDPAPGDQKVEDWLADEILTINEEMSGGGVQEAGRRRQPPSWMPPPAAPAPEWESKPRGAERVSIRKETESFSRTGFAFRAYYEDGTPLNIGGETYDETVRAVMAAWPNTTIVPASNVREAYRGRRRYGDSDAVIKHRQYEEEWRKRQSAYYEKVEPLKAGLVEIRGEDLRSRGLTIPSRANEVLVASLSDPRKGNEPVAHFWQYPGFGYGESGGLSTTYYVEPAIVPAGRETREAREAKRTPTSTVYQEAQVFINGRFQVGFTFTPSRGPEAAAREVLSLTRDGDIIEVKQGQEVWTYKVAGKGNAKRIVTVRETREAYGRRGHRRGGDDRPVAPYYSRKR